MIIFEIDGVIADIEHRLHFVDVYANPSYEFVPKNNHLDWKEGYYCNLQSTPYFGLPWKPDWKRFYESCNEDIPIWSVVRVIESLHLNDVTLQNKEIQIWSGRCESVRDRTIHWLKYIVGSVTYSCLRMRPLGDNRPAHVIKEQWLKDLWPRLERPTKENEGKINHRPDVEMVFENDPESIEMYRRQGIFVFDCRQT